MSKPTFSFITCTYQCAQFVARCYWSLTRQTVADWEWVVVDDGSMDATRQILESIADSRIRYFRFEKNAGRGVARQHALEQAHGEWCVIVDMDDLCFPDRLERAQAARAGGYDFLCSTVTLIGDDYRITGLRGFWKDRYPRSFAHASICAKTALLRSIGYPRYPASEDQTMVLVLANQFNGFYCREPLYIYHESASTNARTTLLGKWYVLLQIWQLLRKGTLRPTLSVLKLQLFQLATIVLLTPFLLLPKAYLWTLRFRGHGLESDKGHPPARTAFVRECAIRFPVNKG